MNAPVILSSLSATNASQVLVSGRATDAVSGRGIGGAGLTLAYDPVGDGAFAALPARLGQHDDGWFSFHLAPGQLRAPAGSAAPVLRVSASAPGHDDGIGELAVTPAQLAVEQESRIVAGQLATFNRLHGGPFRIDMTLAPLAVALDGVVFEGGDPDHPASDAKIAVLAPVGEETVTDAEGGFRIEALPVAATVTIRITHGGAEVDHVVRPNFTQRINRAVFATA